MDTAGYVALSRQSGLLREMGNVANNIANLSTTGYRRQGVVFAEMVAPLQAEGGSVALTSARARFNDPLQGSMTHTANPLDLAIEGPGFFMVETPAGERLTRAGAFLRSAEGELVTPDGNLVLDAAGGPIFLPPDVQNLTIAADGTMSDGGRLLGQIGIFDVTDPGALVREGGTLFVPDDLPQPSENPRLRQGFVEGSNVSPVAEIARMIEVQRAYELGQKFLEREDERIRAVTRTLGRST